MSVGPGITLGGAVGSGTPTGLIGIPRGDSSESRKLGEGTVGAVGSAGGIDPGRGVEMPGNPVADGDGRAGGIESDLGVPSGGSAGISDPVPVGDKGVGGKDSLLAPGGPLNGLGKSISADQ